MNNSLEIYGQFENIQRAAIALQSSGYFKDATSQAQAIAKVMAGAELGLPPFASMAGIHIVQGKPVLGSNIIATLVKNDPRYDYRIITDIADQDKEMYLEWTENGKVVGVSGFTMKEADAGNVNKNWDKDKKTWVPKPTWKAYPSDMLFARAISRGARRFAPGIFGGTPVYTPDEMNIDTDEEGYISQPKTTQPAPPVEDGKFEEVEQPKDEKPKAKTKGVGRFDNVGAVKLAIEKKQAEYEKKEVPVKSGMIGVMVGKLDEICGGDNQRHRFLKFVTGEGSSKKMDDYFAPAILDWCKDEESAKVEARAIVAHMDDQASILGDLGFEV